jgi:methionyl-tRNA formyltransferase
MGFLNFHYGLLPQMRGADPIFESRRQKKTVAGATVHKMDQGLDTGPVVLMEQIPLQPEYTYGMLSSQMAWLGDKMCQQLLPMLQAGQLPATLQNEADACYWPKINERQMSVSWKQQSREDIIALVRACNPIAKGVPVTVNNWKFGICDISEVNLQGDASAIVAGTILACDQQNGLVVCCKEGKAVKIEVIYSAEGVFPGYKLGFFGIQPGMVFTDP